MLPDAAYAAALASIASVGPRRLRLLLDGTPPPAAWASVVAGRTDDQGHTWRDQARRIDVADVWEAHRALGVGILVLGDAGYPAALASDPEAPAVLFALGDPAVVDLHRRVAVVGTRSATRQGVGVAAQLGADLATAGVVVLSGMAIGIDCAAHEGASAGWQAASDGAAPPVAVVAGGLDAPYPQCHAKLCQRVAESGALFSEQPVGTAPSPWQFPMRNRILAGLADVVVVVECHTQGGSLHTVRAAIRRGVSVGAVPGSIRSPASAGTNDLLADGCFVVRDVADVLVAVELARADVVPVRRARRRRDREGASTSTVGTVIAAAVAESVGDESIPAGTDDGSGGDHAVLQVLGHEPCSVEQVLRRTGLPLAAASASLERLRAQGKAQGDAGWWERT